MKQATTINQIRQIHLDPDKPYRLKVTQLGMGVDDGKIITVKARLIQQTEAFFTFEYENERGNIRKITVPKRDYYFNPNIIKPLNGV